MFKSAICTLFEGNYHFGVASLINSVSNQGFKGSVFVGYRKSLPEWTRLATEDLSLNWKGATTLIVNSDVKVHFLPVTVSYQLTNYKPVFMLELFDGPAKDVDQIAYLDPDIVVNCRWEFFQNWMSHGVALVHEIVNNDMPQSHPIRREWEKVIALCNRTVTHNITSYINAGFFGVSKEGIDFLKLYVAAMDVGRTHYNFEDSNFQFTVNRSDIFFAKDQDALNIAAMCCDCPISEMGPEAMDFIHGGFTMSHAVGSPKPWAKNFIMSALKGVPPSLAEKAFWANVTGPIKIHSSSQIKMKLIYIKVAGLIGRFYRRS